MARAALAPAARPLTRLTPDEIDLSAEAIDSFTTAIGGRAQLLAVLAVADGARDIDRVTNLLIDPRYAEWSLRKICVLAGLSVAELFLAYKKALIVRAHLEATQVVAANLVKVVEDVMARSQPQVHTCPTCDGLTIYTPPPTKQVPQPEAIPCPTCKRSATPGTVIERPELDRQKVALELGQLLSSKSGILVQQNTLQVGGAGGVGGGAPGALESLQQAVQQVLYPRAVRPVVEAEVVEAAPAPAEAWPAAPRAL